MPRFSIIFMALTYFATPAIGQDVATCEIRNSPFEQAIKDSFANSNDQQIKGWSQYLNDQFYADMACRLTGKITIEQLKSDNVQPQSLFALAHDTDMLRNQSDALLLVLAAMQDAMLNQ